MQIQYYRQVEWDPDLQDVGTQEDELVVSGQKITPGIPAATPDRFIPGAVLQGFEEETNEFDEIVKVGTIWYNAGNTPFPDWQLLSGGGGFFMPNGPTDYTVGGIPAGTDLGYDPISFQDLHTRELYGFVSPAFLTFLISGQATIIEVGETISGNKTFTWSFARPANVQDMTMDIIDITGGNVLLATDISKNPPAIADVGTVQLTAQGSYSWRGRADTTMATTIVSAPFTVSWYWKRYAGTSASVTLNESGIEALAKATLTNTFADTDNLAAGNYKYWAWPDSLGSPAPVIGFKDAATNLNISMASVGDNAFFSNVQNGWYYGLVSVTNVNGVTTNYRVYRSKFMLGNSIQAIVS